MNNKNVEPANRQDCTYYHWMLHADIERNKKYSHAQNFRLNKKQTSIAKLLNEIQQKTLDPSELTKNCDRAPVLIASQDSSFVIPADPRSPYAFTLNVANSPKTIKRNSFPSHDQVRISLTFTFLFKSTENRGKSINE